MTAPKLRFKEFDGDWELTKLENKIDFLAGYAFDSRLMSNDVQSYQLIKMSNVYQNKLDITRNPSYWKTLDKKIEKFLLSKGDIVLTLTGTVGKTDYGYNVEITEENKFLLNQRLVRLRGKLDKSNSKFIQHRISTDRFFYHFFNSSKGGTGNQSNVSIEDLKLLELPFPSLQEQTKIASFLSAVDEKISQLTQKHELHSQYKQGMMQKLFSQQIRFKADDGSEFGEWEETFLHTFLCESLIKGSKGNKAKKLTVKLWGKGVIPKNEAFQGSENTQYYKRSAGQLIYGKLDFLNCAFGLIPEYLDGFESTIDAPAFDIDNKIVHPYFLINRFLQKDFYQKNGEEADGSRKAKRINQSVFLAMQIDLPSLEEQIKIANFLSSLDQKIEVVAQQIEQAKQWKKGLLQQMFV